MAVSSAGRKHLALQSLVLLFAFIVLIFSARINIWTGFFYHADLFPFGIAIATLIVVGVLAATSKTSVGKPQVHCGVLAALTLFWLAFNSFSTSRYKNVPMMCYKVIPAENPEFRTWCVNVQVVKAFMWIEFVTLVVTLLSLGRFMQREIGKGNRSVMKVPLVKYGHKSNLSTSTAYPFAPGVGTRGNSEFLQFNEKEAVAPQTGAQPQSHYMPHSATAAEQQTFSPTHLDVHNFDYVNNNGNRAHQKFVSGGTVASNNTSQFIATGFPSYYHNAGQYQ